MVTIRLLPDDEIDASKLRAVNSVNKKTELSPKDVKAIENAISDLISHGQSMIEQGASFKTVRELKISDQAVKIIADYRKRSRLQKILQKLGL